MHLTNASHFFSLCDSLFVLVTSYVAFFFAPSDFVGSELREAALARLGEFRPGRSRSAERFIKHRYITESAKETQESEVKTKHFSESTNKGRFNQYEII